MEAAMKYLRKFLAYVIVVMLLLVSLFPLLWTFGVSLKPPGLANVYPPVFIFTPTSINYQELFSRFGFGIPLVNSIILSFSVLVIALAFGSIAAYSLARSRFGGKKLVYGILVVQMIPAMVIIFPLYLTIRALGLLDTIQGLVVAQLTFHLPFVMWVMRQFFMQIPVEIDESARMDGASNYRLFFQIILPISIPGLLSAGIFVFLGSWNDLLFPLLLTINKAITVTLAATNFLTVFDILYSQLDASVFLMILPPVLLAIFARRFIVTGLVGSSVKG
jgi:ABC-type glycerol-3-phosphate transport system permease component